MCVYVDHVCILVAHAIEYFDRVIKLITFDKKTSVLAKISIQRFVLSYIL